MRVGNVNVGWKQRNVEAPSKMKLWVNASIMGFLPAFVMLITILTELGLISKEVDMLLSKLTVVIGSLLKGMEKLTGKIEDDTNS